MNAYPIDTPVIVDDGELRVQGVIKTTYKKKLLVEVDADTAPSYFSIDAIQAAVQGYDLDHFPDNKKYVPYEINDNLIVTPLI